MRLLFWNLDGNQINVRSIIVTEFFVVAKIAWKMERILWQTKLRHWYGQGEHKVRLKGNQTGRG